MVDLEDAFLKKNVPGRYSSWAEENDDKRSSNDNDDNDSEDDDYYFQGLPSTTESKTMPPPANTTQPALRPSGNTGVKGVLADYREAQQDEQLRKEEERLENMKALHRATHPAVRPTTISNNKHDNKHDNKNDDSSDNDSDFNDSDDEFLKQFRNQRLAQLQNTMTTTTTTSSKLLTFGSMTIASPDEYVQLVDKLNPQSYLIVHLYEPSIVQCRMLQSTLEKVATMMNHAKFIQVSALEANPNLDTIILPAILVYRRGELVHNLVRFTEELPPVSRGGFGVEEVREVLEGLLGVSTSSRC